MINVKLAFENGNCDIDLLKASRKLSKRNGTRSQQNKYFRR